MKSRRHIQFLGVLVIVLAVCLVSSPAFAIYYPKIVWQRISAVAGEAITQGQVVCIAAADGLVYKADANEALLRPAIGIAGAKAASGASVEIVLEGRFTGWSSLSPGAAGYLSETPGVVTQSAPAYSQQVGYAVSATDYVFSFRSYQDTSSLTALGVLTGATPLIFEGATVNAYDTTLNVIDPTAARNVDLPNVSGRIVVSNNAAHNYADGVTLWTLTDAEKSATFISAINASGAANAEITTCIPGQFYVFYNTSGATITFKTTAGAGSNVATGKYGLYTCDSANNLLQIYTGP